jgi:hypothetical protein
MSFLRQSIYFLSGLFLAIFEIGFVRTLPGAFGTVSVISMALTIFFFLRQKETTFALAAGIGIGLGFFSAYSFLTWILIVVFAATMGYFLSNLILTDQSLFALVVLNAGIHFSVFLMEIIASNLLGRGVLVKLPLDASSVVSGIGSAIAETMILYFFFLIYRKVRGKKAARLVHVG